MILEVYYFLFAIAILISTIGFILFISNSYDYPQVFYACSGLFLIIISIISFIGGIEVKTGHTENATSASVVQVTYDYIPTNDPLIYRGVPYMLFALGSIIFISSTISFINNKKKNNPDEELEY